MGLFTRRAPRDGPVVTNTPQTGGGILNRKHNKANRTAPVAMSMSTRPSFGQWLKATWLDIFTMAAMGMIGLGVSNLQVTLNFCTLANNQQVYFAHPAPSRSFPVYFQDGEIVYPQFAYPLRNEIVSFLPHLYYVLANQTPRCLYGQQHS